MLTTLEAALCLPLERGRKADPWWMGEPRLGMASNEVRTSLFGEVRSLLITGFVFSKLCSTV